MNTNALTWPPGLICLCPMSIDIQKLSRDLYDRTCRTDFDAPGFCTLNTGHQFNSHSFRKLMVDLKTEMTAIHESTAGRTLVTLSAARFDQQSSTKPHIDSGPDENFLMLGYEPSDVESGLEISDYSKCAFDLGITPKEFMAKHNPMFKSGHDMLRPYSTLIPCFSPTDFQIICVNNSCADYSLVQPAWQGIMHTATVTSPDDSKRRVINSMMISSAPISTHDEFSDLELHDFINTKVVRRRGYDKQHLEDDD